MSYNSKNWRPLNSKNWIIQVFQFKRLNLKHLISFLSLARSLALLFLFSNYQQLKLKNRMFMKLNMHAIHLMVHAFCLNILEMIDVADTLLRLNHNGYSAQLIPLQKHQTHFDSLWRCTQCIRIANVLPSFQLGPMEQLVRFQHLLIYFQRLRLVHQDLVRKWSKQKESE